MTTSSRFSPHRSVAPGATSERPAAALRGPSSRRTAPRAAAFLSSAALAVASLLAAAAPSTAATGASKAEDPRYRSYVEQPLTWSSDACGPEVQGREVVECASVRVPRDWDAPDRGDITISISRAAGEWAQPRRDRLLLSNPGGPGGAGAEYGVVLARALGLDATHSSIGIDPRGTGGGTRLDCGPPRTSVDSYLADGDARTYTPEQVQAAVADNAAWVRQCQQAAGDLLPFINSRQTAYDFDLVRALLGYRTADYLGGSYGSWLGSVMEKLVPESFDRIVLDANVDFSDRKLDANWTKQPEGFQAQIDRVFFPFLARHDDVYHLGATPAEVNASYERLRAAIAAAGGTPDQLDQQIMSAQYSSFSFDETGRALSEALAQVDSGNPGAARVTAEEPDFSTNMLSVFMAVRCNDSGRTTHQPLYQPIAEEQAKTYPTAGVARLVNLCAQWPYPRALSDDLLASPVQGVLMTQSESDPPTPYKGNRKVLRRQAGQVRMALVDDFAGHGVVQADPCAYRTAMRYLASGTYPAADVRCQAGPIISGTVADGTVYEFGYPSSDRRPLPRVYEYPTRDLSAPVPDASAPTMRAQATESFAPAGDPAAVRRLRELTSGQVTPLG